VLGAVQSLVADFTLAEHEGSSGGARKMGSGGNVTNTGSAGLRSRTYLDGCERKSELPSYCWTYIRGDL